MQLFCRRREARPSIEDRVMQRPQKFVRSSLGISAGASRMPVQGENGYNYRLELRPDNISSTKARIS